MLLHRAIAPLRSARLLPWLLLLIVWTGACADAVQGPAADFDPDPIVEADRFQSGLQVWGNGVSWNDSLYDLVADYDLFSYMAHQMYSGQSEDLTHELRTRNPDMLIGSYFQAHGVQEWQIAELDAGNDNFSADWAELALRHLAVTTKGDTARSFNRAYMIDITAAGVIEEMVEVLAHWQSRSANSGPGAFVMIDHCSVPHESWLTGPWAQQTDGDLDLDRDGIGHIDDQDEQAALTDAYHRLVEEFHRALPDVKVVVNGDLMHQDPGFRSKIDGMYIEGGFRWRWGGRYFDRALIEPGEQNLHSLLADMRDGGFTIYEWKEDYRVGWAVGMFFDNVIPLMAPGHEVLPFELLRHPGEWDVGRPMGPAEVVDGILIREFERGTARLESIHGTTPAAFRFKLSDRDRGVLVEFIEGV